MFRPPPSSFVNFQPATASARGGVRNPLQQSADASSMAGTGPNMSWGGNSPAPSAPAPTAQNIGGITYNDPGAANAWDWSGLSAEDQGWNLRSWATNVQRTLIPQLLSSLGDIGPGLENMRAARGQANEAISTRGREKMVGRFGTGAAAAAYKMGKMIAARLRARGVSGADEAGDLMAYNSASQQQGDYRRQVNSPESLAKFAEIAMQLNNPMSTAAMVPFFANIDASSQGAMNQFLQANAQNDARGTSIGDIVGMGLGLAKSYKDLKTA